jgi:hypothetical protein
MNDYSSCVLGNHTTDRLQADINESLAAFIVKTDCDTLSAILKMSVKGASTIVGHLSWLLWGETDCKQS